MGQLSNFYYETEHYIRMLNKSPRSIIFIGTKDGEHSCTWEEFQSLADKEYVREHPDNTVISHNLIIVFSDYSIMYRGIDDNFLECWNIMTPLRKKTTRKSIEYKDFIWN